MAHLEIAPVTPLMFDVMAPGAYRTFIPALRDALVGASTGKVVGPISGVQRHMLGEQNPGDQQPPRWIHVELHCEGGVAPKVAIRSDNAYIIGFSNRKGIWFQLSKTTAKEKLVSENPVLTGFDSGYGALVGNITNLPNLNLNKLSTAVAAGKLWNHTRKLNGGDEDEEDDAAIILTKGEIETAVATLCVVLSESARITDVNKIILGGWDTPSKVSITQKEVGYCKDWSDMCSALLSWKGNKYRDDSVYFEKFKETIKIHNGEEALKVVQIVLQARRRKSLLAWLKYIWGLLLKKLKLQQLDDTAAGYKKAPKGSAAVNPL